MKYKFIVICITTLIYLVFNVSMADQSSAMEIVPSHEHEIANKQKLSGPTKTKGIESVTLLGTIGLEKDFPMLQGKQLRARELVIQPGGVVAVHQHDSRPGVAYILEGEITEHRNDQDQPILRSKGAVAFEQSGVAHWWEKIGRASGRERG